MVDRTNKIGPEMNTEINKMKSKEKTKTLADAFNEVNSLADEVKKLTGGHLSPDKEKALSRLESYIKHQIFKNPKEFGIR